MRLKNLEKPNDPLIEKYAKKVNSEERYAIGDKILRKLFRCCSRNDNLEDVWLKTIVVNKLYSAGIRGAELKMAKHIVKVPDFVIRIKNGDFRLVEEIRKGHEIRRNGGNSDIDFYAFATKYCFEHSQDEHSQDKYPIYDSYVSKMLLLYRDKNHFAEFTG